MSQQAIATDQWVTFEAPKLHYRDWGNETAQPMLCLHGFTGSANNWDMFAAAMSKDYHVLALDQLGHGDSDWLEDPRDYTYPRHAEAIAGFVNTLGLEKLILIGLSMGGRNAWTYTLRHPDKAAQLIIVDVAPYTANQQPSERWRNFVQMHQEIDEFKSPRHVLDVMQSVRPQLRDDEMVLDQIKRNMKQLPNGRLTWKYDRRKMKWHGDKYFDNIQMPEETWEELRQIQCPTLVIRGALSETLSPELASRMCDTIPNCQWVEVPNAYHGVTADNPEGFEAAVRQFLENQVRTAINHTPS